ncbi:type IV pilin [Halobacterium zhouii]|uniref:type IV pilin n=1 Tax=Halobacterium zhouii TaxID=2902624 RepID=UPI001E380468|nr:type IV pilin [Halobacterium zhouii]
MARASTTPVAVALLVAVTVVAAAGFATALPALPSDPEPHRAVSADATPDGAVALTLLSGPSVDVRNLDVRVTVDGRALRHQPPVPFFAAHGFRGGPTGPFNVAADPTWSVGETASFRVASTNHPVLRDGDTVKIRLLVRGQVVAVATDRA